MHATLTESAFSSFFASNLVLRQSEAPTLPAPTATRKAFEASEHLRAALRRDTVPAPATASTLAEFGEWEV